MAATNGGIAPANAAAGHRRLSLRSVVAVASGFVAVVVLSLVTDEVMHVLQVYPPWGEPMNDTGDNLLALSYRCVFGVLGSYVTAGSRRSHRCDTCGWARP
jgi:hypothetical protein